jgi:glycine cleavage system H protein
MIPEELKYNETHEWARFDPQTNKVTVGLSDFAVEQLGDIVFLELPQVGTEIKFGNSFGVIESVKAAADLYAPATGVITEVNDTLPDNLELLQKDPYGQGWLVRITIESAEGLKMLMDATAYGKHILEKH